MSKKFKRFIIHDPVFHASVYVQLGGDPKKAVDWFANDIKVDEYEADLRDSSGKFFENSSHHGGCIWTKNKSDILSLIHEALHATHYILRRMRIELREDSEEVFCYYQEWLLREISLKAGLKL